VGEHQKGLYALPSLVDKNTPRISTSPPIKLLDGPTGEQNSNQDTDPRTVYIKDVLQEHPGIMLGHYNMPNEGNGNLQLSPTPSGSKGVQSFKNAKPWNITFYDYNAVSAPPELAKEYGECSCPKNIGY